MPSLQGRVIALAGATGGWGAATAKLLAAEGASSSSATATTPPALSGSVRSVWLNRRFCRADLLTAEGRRALLDAAPNLYGLVVLLGDPARGQDEETCAAPLTSISSPLPPQPR